MKITFEINTDNENFDRCELEQLKHAENMAHALFELEQQVIDWYKYPSDTIELNADNLKERFYEILFSNNISIDKIWS